MPENIQTIAASSVNPVTIYKTNSYSYKTNAAQSGILDLACDTGDVKFLRFSTVNLTAGADVTSIDGGKESISYQSSTKLKNGVSVITENWKYAQGSGGKLSAVNAEADTIKNYSCVTLENAIAGEISNNTVSYSETAQNGNSYFAIAESSKKTLTSNTAGTLTAADSTIGEVTGFATVKLTGCETATLSRLSDSGKSYSAVTEEFSAASKNGRVSGTYTQTIKYSHAGTLTAADSTMDDVINFNTVTLDNSHAAAITNERVAQQKYGYSAEWERVYDYSGFDAAQMELLSETEKLSGSVALKNNSYACAIENFSSVTLSQSGVGQIVNVNKVTISSGFNTIGTFTGTSGNDTLTISKNAVLALGAVDMAGGAKDKFVNNGTLILTGDVDRSFLSGKGEIAAASDVYDILTDKTGVINIGTTAEGFRTTKYENSDDTLKKAVKWDLKSGDYTGWLGGNDCDVVDTIDYIKFTVSKNDVDKELTVSGVDSFTLYDKKGNEVDCISAVGTYTLKLDWNETDSTKYTLALV